MYIIAQFRGMYNLQLSQNGWKTAENQENSIDKSLTNEYNASIMNVFIKGEIMPKIIENLREKLLEEAKRQVMEQGYSAMTIRSVASACGVGVGTVYNYFPSKDMLVASFMLADWLESLSVMEAGCFAACGPEAAIRCIYDELRSFMEKYAPLFSNKDAEESSSVAFHQRHGILRAQIAKLLLPLCEKQKKAEPAFLAEFIAESLLAWTRTDRKFEEISGILLQLF